MAISEVNIQLGSLLGATQTGGSLTSIRPSVQTTATFNGSTSVPVVNDIPLLTVSTLTSFFSIPNYYSNTQSVSMSNIGTAPVTVTNIVFTVKGVTPLFTFLPGAVLYNTVTNTATTFTIDPGNTKEVWLQYKGDEVGEYENYISIISNSITGQYKVNTQQVVDNAVQITATPTSASTTTVAYGEAYDVAYTLEASFNNTVINSSEVTYSGVVTSGAGWEVLGQGSTNNEILVRFDSNHIGDVNGVYTSNITINGVYGGLGGSVTTVNTATVNIDPTQFKNLGYWISPASSYNSIIGVSYDIIAGIKYLTIGVGTGADSTPTYDQGGNVYASIITLGIKAGPAAVRSNPYLGWANVWRFPIAGAAATYYSNTVDDGNNYVYKQKTTADLDYEYYFGSESSNRCMFIVEHDGEGNLSVSMNSLREYSGDSTFDATLNNLTRAFYYYSEADTPARYTGPYAQPTTSYPPILAVENQTQVFKGFKYNQATREALVDTYLAPYPT